jgi:hypothetical protein
MTASAAGPSLRQRLRVVPPELVEAIRAATIDQDPDRLYDLIDGVAEHDSEVATYLRGLLEDVAYDSLEDFFDIRGR